MAISAGRKMITLAIALASLLTLPAHANIISNGSFESGFKNTATPGVCSDTVSGWSVASLGSCGGIDWISSSLWTAQAGNFSIDLNSFNTGAISQSFATVAGGQYQVSFYLAGNPGQQNIKNLDVLIDGVDRVAGSPDFSFNNARTSGSNMGWTLNTFTFTASNATTDLQFKSLMLGAAGPALANISVVAIPEPGTYAMLLAGFALLGGVQLRRKS
jgi:choice-of-anchor C domain-containing protein